MKSSIIYKVRNPNTGLFSKGGTWAEVFESHWSKRGKTWSDAGALRRHLQFYAAKLPNDTDIPEHWEVVVVGYISDDGIPPEGYIAGQTFNAREFYHEAMDAKLAKQKEKEQRLIEKARLEDERKERELFEKLKQKYES